MSFEILFSRIFIAILHVPVQQGSGFGTVAVAEILNSPQAGRLWSKLSVIADDFGK